MPKSNSTPNKNKTKYKSSKRVNIEYAPVVQVLVIKDNAYFSCQPTPNGWKCGKCLFGLILPFATKDGWSNICLRCKAELFETKYGRNYFDMKLYKP